MAQNPTTLAQLPALRSVSVTGFQKTRSFRVALDPKVNFLYGRNGSGKTTLINLINNALTLDVLSLFTQDFSEMELVLSYGSRAARVLKYRKLQSDSGVSVDFEVMSGTNVLLHRQFTLSDIRRPTTGIYWSSFGEANTPVDYWLPITNSLGLKRPSVTWLSVQRSAMKAVHESLSLPDQSPVDQRLSSLIKKTTAFLSLLDSQSARLNLDFQRDFILSLINYDHATAISRVFPTPQALDFDQDEKTIEGIFDHLGIPRRKYAGPLKAHFSRLRAQYEEHSPNVMMTEFLMGLVDTYRLHDLIERFQTVQVRRQQIYQPKQEFLALLNRYYVDKRVTFDNRNQPSIALHDEIPIEIEQLSSGEKQIYIILSETLTQEGKRSIFLADEPEISLHVEWQEMLVESVTKINPNCQILFATHSPDILGVFGDKAINMEKL